MFNVVYPNRWFIWAVVACLVVGVFVWWQIELYSLDQELANEWAREPHRKISQPAGDTSTIDTSTWKTYRNEEFGFQIKNLDDRIPFRVFVDATSTLSYGWAGGEAPSFTLHLRHNLARFHQFIYNPYDDANEDLTYSPVEQQWVVTSHSDNPVCPMDLGDPFTKQNVPSYKITTGHHYGDDYFIYVTSKGMIAFLGGDNIKPGGPQPSILFDHPESVLKATCRIVKQ